MSRLMRFLSFGSAFAKDSILTNFASPRVLRVRMIAILFDDGARRQDVRKTLAVDLARYAGIIVIDVR